MKSGIPVHVTIIDILCVLQSDKPPKNKRCKKDIWLSFKLLKQFGWNSLCYFLRGFSLEDINDNDEIVILKKMRTLSSLEWYMRRFENLTRSLIWRFFSFCGNDWKEKSFVAGNLMRSIVLLMCFEVLIVDSIKQGWQYIGGARKKAAKGRRILNCFTGNFEWISCYSSV